MLLVLQVMSRLQAGCFCKKRKTDKVRQQMQKNTLIWKLVPTPTANPQALLDKFIKDKKSPTVHCANLLKTNFLEA